MKSALNLSLFLLSLFSFSDKAFSLSDYQIRNICMKERIKSICIKNLQEKRANLKKGKLIEIPVIPYKR